MIISARTAICSPTAGFLCRASAETIPNFQKISEFLPELVSQRSRWIPKPQFWHPPLRLGFQDQIPQPLFFLVFLAYTADFGFYLLGDKFFLRRLSPKFVSQHQFRTKTTRFIVAHVRRDLLSRCTCRSRSPGPGAFKYSSGIALQPPKGPCRTCRASTARDVACQAASENYPLEAISGDISGNLFGNS